MQPTATPDSAIWGRYERSGMARPEIGGDDGGVLADRRGRALRQSCGRNPAPRWCPPCSSPVSCRARSAARSCRARRWRGSQPTGVSIRPQKARPPARRAAGALASRPARVQSREAAAGRRRARSPPLSAAPSSPTKSSSSRARASTSRSACRVPRVRSKADRTPPLVWRWQPTWTFSSTDRF